MARARRPARPAPDAVGRALAPTRREPDLVLEPAALGAVYLGGTTLLDLAGAGRVEERTPGSLARASAAFRGEVAPWCPEIF